MSNMSKMKQLALPNVPVVAKKLQPFKITEDSRIDGYEVGVERVAQFKEDLKKADENVALARLPLESKAKERQQELERSGTFLKKLTFVGKEHGLAFQFTDAYAPMAVAIESELTNLLGATVYAELFQRVREASVVDADRLKKAIDLLDISAVATLVEFQEMVVPREDFRRRRFEQRATLSAEQNKALDAVIEQIASRPSMTVI